MNQYLKEQLGQNYQYALDFRLANQIEMFLTNVWTLFKKSY